jgi:glycine oxidase
VTACDVVVVGGGIIGLSSAWRALGSGRSVTVVDPEPGRGASYVAAGMLAPVTEARAAEEPLARLGLASVQRWPAFADELGADAGVAEVGLRREGTLQVAFDEDDRRALDELAAVHGLLGLESERLGSRGCRHLVPLLAPRVRGGLLVPGDWQADPRRVVSALLAAVVRRGGTVRAAAVAGLHRGVRGGPVDGVVLANGTVLAASAVVLAAGTGLPRIGDLPSEVRLPIRPVKGEILRLRADPSVTSGLPMTVRATVQGQPVYLVPRLDGEVVVGATAQEAGYDTTVRSGAVLELLRAAVDLVPALGEVPLAEVTAGLRPATPDNAPVIGPTVVEGLHVATGHYRNGVLLAPITAELVVSALESGRLPEEAAAFSARRFG